MAQDKPRHSEKVFEYLTAQVLDHGAKLRPLVRSLNAGELEGFPADPLSYSAAYRRVRAAERERDAATPLTDRELERFYRRLWAIALTQLRAIERDSARGKTLDLKRLNALEETATRLRRHLANRGKPDTPEPDSDDKPETPSLLASLAAEHTAQSSAAVANPH